MLSKRKETSFNGQDGEQFSFYECDELTRGRSGFFGIIRLGRSSRRNCSLAIKELVPGKNEMLSFAPLPAYLVSTCKVLENALRDRTSEEEMISADHVLILQSPSGSKLLGVRSAKSGKIEGLTLQNHIDIFGFDSEGSESSRDRGLFVPAAWTNFLAQRLRIRKEIEAMEKIPDHPNLIKMLGHGEIVDGNILRTFLVLPFYGNGDLMDRMNGEAASVQKAMGYFLGMMQGLKALHDAGLCHRDLKLDNVLIADDGVTPVIADFGFCSTTRSAEGEARVNHNRVGSPLIRAPEIWEKGTALSGVPGVSRLKEGYCGEKADMWSMGIVLFNLLTRTDFWTYIGASNKWCKMKTAVETDPVFRLLARGEARLTENVPEKLRSYVLRLLAVRPEDRPTATETLETFTEFLFTNCTNPNQAQFHQILDTGIGA